MLDGLFSEGQKPKKVQVKYQDGTEEYIEIVAFKFVKGTGADFIAFKGEDEKVYISKVRTEKDKLIMSDDYTDEMFEAAKKVLFSKKTRNYNFSMIPSIIYDEEGLNLDDEEEVVEEQREEAPAEEEVEIVKSNPEDKEYVDEDDIPQIPIYQDEEGNYYEDKWGAIQYTEEEVDEMFNNENYELIVKPVKPSIFNMKRTKVIYYDEEGFYFKDKYGKKPLSEEQLEKYESDKRIILREQPIKKKMSLFRTRVDLFVIGDKYYLEKECTRQIKPEVVERLYEDPKNKIVEHNVEELIVYIDMKTKKCYLDPNGIRRISRDKLDNYDLSDKYVVRYQTLEKKKTKKRLTVYIDQFGTIYAEPEAKRVINKEKLDKLREDENVVIIEEAIRIEKKKTILNVFVDEDGRTYFDKAGKSLIDEKQIALLEENQDIVVNRLPIKKVVKQVVTSPKVVEVKTEEKKEATAPKVEETPKVETPKVETPKVEVPAVVETPKKKEVEIPVKKEEVKERIVYVSDGEYFWDKLATMKMSNEEYQALVASPKYKVVEQKIGKRIVLVFTANGNYYYDALGVNRISPKKIEVLKSLPQVDLVINEIEQQVVTVYKDGENYYHDEDKLTPYTQAEIIDLGKNPLYRINVKTIVTKKSKSELTEEEIRSKMAEILNVSNMEDIEKANEHDISYQLDDWEIDEFQELREELKGRSR